MVIVVRKNDNRFFLTALLLLSFLFYAASFYSLWLEEPTLLKFSDLQLLAVQLLGVLFAALFLRVRKEFFRVSLFGIGILVAIMMFFPFAFICIDRCPNNSLIIFTLVVFSSLIFIAVHIWSLFKNNLFKGSFLLITIVLYLLLLVTSLPFKG